MIIICQDLKTFYRCKDLLQKIFQNLLNQNEDFADSLTVRFLKYRLEKCQDDAEALDLAKVCNSIFFEKIIIIS